jgi:hypothetical protein
MLAGSYSCLYSYLILTLFLSFSLSFTISVLLVVGVDAELLVMTSIRKPKRVKLFTSSGREALFLVKGGEDLRNDERIQLLFTLMNNIIANSNNNTASDTTSSTAEVMSKGGSGRGRGGARGSASGLSARTYTVIPMTSKVGILEWVKNTVPLKAVVAEEMAKDAAFCAANPHAVIGGDSDDIAGSSGLGAGRGRGGGGGKRQQASARGTMVSSADLSGADSGQSSIGSALTRGASSSTSRGRGRGREVQIESIHAAEQRQLWLQLGTLSDETGAGTGAGTVTVTVTAQEYHAMFRRASASQARAVYRAVTELVPNDLIRRRLMQIATGPEVTVILLCT